MTSCSGSNPCTTDPYVWAADPVQLVGFSIVQGFQPTLVGGGFGPGNAWTAAAQSVGTVNIPGLGSLSLTSDATRVYDFAAGTDDGPNEVSGSWTLMGHSGALAATVPYQGSFAWAMFVAWNGEDAAINARITRDGLVVAANTTPGLTANELFGSIDPGAEFAATIGVTGSGDWGSPPGLTNGSLSIIQETDTGGGADPFSVRGISLELCGRGPCP